MHFIATLGQLADAATELEQLRLPMMLRLREQVTEKLEGERWQYESVERFQPAL